MIRRRWARIDGVVKARFIVAVRAGARLEDAAREAGCSLHGLYAARRRDPDLRARWRAALAESAAAERRIVPHNHRRLQLRRKRAGTFDTAARGVFLAHFAGTCDLEAAAAEAGVDRSTVFKHRRRDAAFSADFDDALDQGYARLEAEAVRQRLAAQERMRTEPVATGEVAAEFERVLKLLARWDRRGKRSGPRRGPETRRPRATIEEIAAALHARLQHLDIPILHLPPPAGEPET